MRRIIVDRDVCIGAGTCVRLARATFALDAEDVAVVVDADADTDQKVDAAAGSCPSGAIVVVRS